VLAVFTLGAGIPIHASAEEEGAASSHIHGDLMLFPAITGTHLSDSVPGLEQNELVPEANIFYSTEHDRVRFLAEFLLNSNEHEMERMQLGWLVQPAGHPVGRAFP
jgi:hypothetical protein